MNSPVRPPEISGGTSREHRTFTSNRGLQLEEPLLFEVGRQDVTGVDIEPVAPFAPRLGDIARKNPIGLPGLSEPECLRHYVRLSQKNYAIDAGIFPLGSCTMKHNPRLNERMARLPGFADIHPLQPQSTVRGALELMEELGRWLMTMTGMPAIALSPKAGAHGELCGMMAIRAAIEARDEGTARRVVLVPDSAHGTNPATSTLCGFETKSVPARADGTIDPVDVRRLATPDIAAIMLTNPNTCGLFERDVVEIGEIIHAAGGYFYCDGANFNAIMGKVRPGDLGIDGMHINLHKTFSTPHGGGGPGAGPVVFSERLAAFTPHPYLRNDAAGLRLVEDTESGSQSLGRITAFHGQMGMFVRAMAYMLSHGANGLRQASEDAVLNANYIRAGLDDVLSAPFGRKPCMHEALFDDVWLKPTGLTVLDFAKAIIDEGFHPMTVYFPLVVSGALLIEPTESESKASLDLFIATLRDLASAALSGERQRFTEAPALAPRKRLDETRAARQPILKWTET
jgi:glycine dehydrogenase subunit 2